ncbi:amidohydrolase [Rhodococcus koreensis]
MTSNTTFQSNTVLHNVKFLPSAFDGPADSDSVLIKDGLIENFGTFADISDRLVEHPVPGVTVIDGQGGTVVPGFVDGHCHFEMACTVQNSWVKVQTPPFTSLAAIADELGNAVKATPPGQWILGRSSFSMHEKVAEQRLFTRQELDAVSQDYPIGVFASLHVASFNTHALKELGLWSADTRHPEHGIIHRDASGEPTGVVTEAFLLPPVATGIRDQFKALTAREAANRWNAAGITSCHTMPETLDQAMWEREQHRAAELSIRQRHFFITPALGTIAQIDGYRAEYESSGDMVSFGGVKLFVNGCAHDGYGHAADDYKWTQDELDAVVEDAHRRRIQLWMHSLNDHGIKMAAIAVSRAQAKYPWDHRHRIEHGGDYINLDDLDVVRSSGVLLVTTPQFLRSTSGDVGDKHAPWRTIIDSGIRLVGGTDSTGTVPESVSVLNNIEIAASRTSNDGVVIGQDECLSVSESFALFTEWSAYGGFEEDQKGRLRRGMLGDVVVLDQDPMGCPPAKLGSIGVEKSILGGREVYSRG